MEGDWHEHLGGCGDGGDGGEGAVAAVREAVAVHPGPLAVHRCRTGVETRAGRHPLRIRIVAGRAPCHSKPTPPPLPHRPTKREWTIGLCDHHNLLLLCGLAAGGCTACHVLPLPHTVHARLNYRPQYPKLPQTSPRLPGCCKDWHPSPSCSYRSKAPPILTAAGESPPKSQALDARGSADHRPTDRVRVPPPQTASQSQAVHIHWQSASGGQMPTFPHDTRSAQHPRPHSNKRQLGRL